MPPLHSIVVRYVIRIKKILSARCRLLRITVTAASTTQVVAWRGKQASGATNYSSYRNQRQASKYESVNKRQSGGVGTFASLCKRGLCFCFILNMTSDFFAEKVCKASQSLSERFFADATRRACVAWKEQWKFSCESRNYEQVDSFHGGTFVRYGVQSRGSVDPMGPFFGVHMWKGCCRKGKPWLDILSNGCINWLTSIWKHVWLSCEI